MTQTDSFRSFADSDDALFHYTSLSTALEHILASGKLRFSPLSGTDDPNEYKFKLLNMTGWSLSRGTEKLHSEAHPVFDRIVRRDCGVLCFCANSDPALELEDSSTIEPRNLSGPGWLKPRMWSQYGDQHRGACLVFSRKGMQEVVAARRSEFDWYRSGFVKYSQRSDRLVRAVNLDGNELEKKGVEAYCREHVESHHKALFLTKHIDYRDEAEFRVVVASSPAKSAELFLDISEVLKGIIVGDRSADVYYSLIDALAEPYGAATRQVYWDRGFAHLLHLEKPNKDESEPSNPC